jgi:hypothetical protein
MKNYQSYNIRELRALDNLILTKNEFYNLVSNKNIKYYKYLNENRIYIKLIGSDDYLIIYIEE